MIVDVNVTFFSIIIKLAFAQNSPVRHLKDMLLACWYLHHMLQVTRHCTGAHTYKWKTTHDVVSHPNLYLHSKLSDTLSVQAVFSPIPGGGAPAADVGGAAAPGPGTHVPTLRPGVDIALVWNIQISFCELEAWHTIIWFVTAGLFAIF